VDCRIAVAFVSILILFRVLQQSHNENDSIGAIGAIGGGFSIGVMVGLVVFVFVFDGFTGPNTGLVSGLIIFL
jgi:VIT1/CCC1 family predicted Fe2+/Mn2+ transporter